METSTKVIIGVVSIAIVGTIAYFVIKGKKTVVIPQPQLTWIESKSVSDFLQSKFSAQQLVDLRGWLQLIKQERSKDSSKWMKNDDFATEQISDIGHALYQMNTWDMATRQELQDLK